MPNPYAIFTSYACLDVNETTHRSFRRFLTKIRDLVGPNVGWHSESTVCFVDKTNIKLGDVWDQKLAEAIGSAQVLVCLVSPYYLKSEWCGRELRLFLERLEALPGNQQHPQRVFPLIWIHPSGGRKLPEVISRLQFKGPGLPQAYFTNGLRDLALKPKFKNALIDVASVLSTRITEALAGQPPLPPHAGVHNGWTKSDWEAVINCLEGARQACDLEILSCMSLNEEIQKTVVLGDLTIQLEVRIGVACYCKFVTWEQISGNLDRVTQLDGIPVLLAAWDSPHDVATVIREAAKLTVIGVVILDSSSVDAMAPQPITIAGLQAEIQSLETKGRLVRCTPQTLAPALERLAIQLRNERLAPLESARVISAEIEQRATAQGVPTAQRPDVLGPNGRGGP